MFLVNQKEIKSLRQHRSRQTLHMVQRSCLAGYRLFTRWCTLNTCKSEEQNWLLLGLSGEELGAGEQELESTQLSHSRCARSPEIPVSCQQGLYQPPTGTGSDFFGAARKVETFSLPFSSGGPFLFIGIRGWGAIRSAAVPPPLSQEASPLPSEGVEANTVSWDFPEDQLRYRTTAAAAWRQQESLGYLLTSSLAVIRIYVVI